MGEKGYQETGRSVDTRRVVLAPEVIRWEKKLMRTRGANSKPELACEAMWCVEERESATSFYHI